MFSKTSEIRSRSRRNHTKDEFDMRLKQIISEFAEKSLLNVVPFWENEDPATYVSICPTSAHTGDGMGNMMWYMVNFCQNHLKKRLAFRSEPQATVLEIKEIQGLGTTIDINLVNGKLKEADSIVVAGYEEPIQTHVKALIAPLAMKGSRVKSHYEFLKQSQIPYSGINIGPVHKKDVMKASTMLEHNNFYGVILAFDVKVERDALELADSSGIKIFTADIIYHLFDKFQGYKEDLKQKAKDKHCHVAMFPCKLRILPNCIFNSRDPIIIGVTVAGIVKAGKQSCVPSKEGLILGTIASLETNKRPVDFARQGTDVCIKIENTNGEAPKLYGRHFDSTDLLQSEFISPHQRAFMIRIITGDWPSCELFTLVISM